MLSKFLFNRTSIPILKKGLDVSSLRQRVIADNIANISTPNYRRIEVSFEKELEQALNEKGVKGWATHPKHIPMERKDIAKVEPSLFNPPDDSNASGVNNVDIDQEMAQMAKNEIFFSYLARLLAKNFNALRGSIRGKAVG